ncbi:penicillin-binding protein activator LpoB [bacterium]|nr:penicillin-binding protein activator LpoB [bacterium]
MKKVTILLTLLALVVSACGTKTYTKGKYVDPDEVYLLSDKFVESDLQMIAEQLSESLLSSDMLGSQSKKPAIIISLFTNSTDEHIDILSLTNKMRVKLLKSNRFVFLNERLRKEMAKEYEYQSSGYVNPETAKQKGKQIGADWLISGHITSIRQPVGKKEIVYYKTTLEVTDLETSAIMWADEVEVKKAFKSKRVRM